MRPRILSTLFALAVLPAFAASAPASPAKARPDPRPPAPVLRGAQCLEPGIARGFVSLDDRTVLVDAGRNRYRIEVSAACWNLDLANVVGFRGDPVMNRVCGSSLDAVLVRGSPPCRIERMELIDKEAYKSLLREHEAGRAARKAERKAKSGTP